MEKVFLALSNIWLRICVILLDYNPVQYRKQYFEILVYHENLVTISFTFNFWFGRETEQNLAKDP